METRAQTHRAPAGRGGFSAPRANTDLVGLATENPIYEEDNLGSRRNYIYLNRKLLARVDGTIDTGEKYWFLTDHLGSARGLTDNQGNLVWWVDYEAFGETKGQPGGNASLEVPRFTGKAWDENVGLYYFNARWYEAGLGGFTCEDPVGDPNNPNLYSYCANNPMARVDPTGLEWELVGYQQYGGRRCAVYEDEDGNTAYVQRYRGGGVEQATIVGRDGTKEVQRFDREGYVTYNAFYRYSDGFGYQLEYETKYEYSEDKQERTVKTTMFQDNGNYLVSKLKQVKKSIFGIGYWNNTEGNIKGFNSLHEIVFDVDVKVRIDEMKYFVNDFNPGKMKNWGYFDFSASGGWWGLGIVVGIQIDKTGFHSYIGGGVSFPGVSASLMWGSGLASHGWNAAVTGVVQPFSGQLGYSFDDGRFWQGGLGASAGLGAFLYWTFKP